MELLGGAGWACRCAWQESQLGTPVTAERPAAIPPGCRLYIEARGEADLRPPSQSSLGFVVHRGGDGAEERRRLEERLQQLQARWGPDEGSACCAVHAHHVLCPATSDPRPSSKPAGATSCCRSLQPQRRLMRSTPLRSWSTNCCATPRSSSRCGRAVLAALLAGPGVVGKQTGS